MATHILDNKFYLYKQMITRHYHGDQVSLGLQVREIDTDSSVGSLEHLMEIFRLTAAEFEVLTDLMSD